MTRSVLHLLPHPGGGGETYVRQLERIDGYVQSLAFLAPSSKPSPATIHGALRAQLRCRDYDVIHVHGEVAGALCLPVLASKSSVITLHGLHLVRRLEGWKRRLAQSNLHLLVRAASATICVGAAEYADVRRMVGERQDVVMVANGVDVPAPADPAVRARARASLDLADDVVVGIHVAGLESHKEPMVAAAAAQAAASRGVPVVMLFVGDGELRGDLESLADRTHTVRVLGYRTDVEELLAAADFLILASRREGSSFALLEALVHGLPAIVSDSPGNPDVVGDAGIVVSRGDVEAFTEAVVRLAQDSAMRCMLGRKARDRVAARFTAEAMAEQTRAVYEHVLLAT